jgi:hypothetical protein
MIQIWERKRDGEGLIDIMAWNVIDTEFKGREEEGMLIILYSADYRYWWLQ